jgi:hypothetical protein
MLSEGQRKRDEDNPMQDLIQDYASDLKKLREVFHKELTATADELSKAMGDYAHRSQAALASFMEKASARGLELEVSATASSVSFAAFRQTVVSRTSMRNRSRLPQMPMCLESQPLQSRRSRMVCMSRATAITSPSQRLDYLRYSGTGRQFTSSFRRSTSKLRT